MPPAAKKRKLAKPEFVPPPGGGQLETPIPGLKLKDDTGDVARWWPNDEHATNGKAPFLCNVVGVSWAKQKSKWQVQHISAATNKRAHLGYFAAFADACAARAAVVNSKIWARKKKKQKLAKPAFVFPPGGDALEAPLPGLLLKEGTGNVARWWPNIKAGKAAYQCNVVGVSWEKRRSKWMVSHISVVTNKQKTLGNFACFADACDARAAAVDGKAAKGDLEVVEGQVCVTHCGQATCHRAHIPATEFAPDVFMYKKEFSKYAEALALLVHGLTPTIRIKIDRRRRSHCLHCRSIAYKSQAEGENNEVAKCRRVIEEIKAHWAGNGGCTVCGCCDTDVLSGDHKGRQGKDAEGQCLDAAWWTMHGGAEALREHYLGPNTAVQCLCLFCHYLEKSHDIHTGADLKDLADGSDAKIQRDYRLDKQAHANKEKKRRGKCEHPQCCDRRTGLPRVVTATTCHAYHFAHKDEVDKMFTIAKMVANTKSPATAIPKLDKEMAKCNLYCANCHHKYDTLPRMKEGQELLDALLERGAPVCEVCE